MTRTALLTGLALVLASGSLAAQQAPSRLVGTEQRRDYRIRGDTLSIGVGAPPVCRRLIRVR